MSSHAKIKSNNKRATSKNKINQNSKRIILKPRRVGNYSLAEIREAILAAKSNGRK